MNDNAINHSLQGPLTFGVEEEFLVLDASTGQPKQIEPSVLQQHPDCPAGQWSIEAHIGMLEHGTPIFTDVNALSQHLIDCRQFLQRYCQQHQLQLFCGGSHPQLDWRQQPLQPYYQRTAHELRQLLNQLFTFGMHCHIGNCPPLQLPALFNALRPFLAPLLALCANSGWFAGQDTGLASYRSALLAQLPRAGTPAAVHSHADEMAQIRYLVESGMMEKPNSIWTDARLHPRYQTIEIRVMDMQTDARQSGAVAALIGCLATYLYRQINEANAICQLADWQLRENRWQAVRHGKAARFLWLGEVISCQQFWLQWLPLLQPVFNHSGSMTHWLFLHEQLELSVQHRPATV
jgi:carboxylate-amine ligase